MAFSLGLIVLGLLMLVLGGEALLRGAVGLATWCRLTPAVIGLTVVAAGTSVPELAVSGVAAYENKNDIAVANVIGSNIFNIAFILGMCAVIRPFRITGNTLTVEYPVLAAVTVFCAMIVWNGWIQRWEAALCVVTYVSFTVFMVRLVRRQVTEAEAQEFSAEVEEYVPKDHPPRLWLCTLYLLVGIALLGLGAHTTVVGAVELARLLGWTERVIGLTIVSIGTGLPEVVASMVSSLRGRSDVAVGNIIGSNLFNILGILGLTGLINPLPVQPELINKDLWWMLGVTLILLPMMLRAMRVSRYEGALLLIIYAVYMTLILISPGPAAELSTS